MHGWLADKEGVKVINSFLDRVEESMPTKAGHVINYLNSTEQSEEIEVEEESHWRGNCFLKSSMPCVTYYFKQTKVSWWK